MVNLISNHILHTGHKGVKMETTDYEREARYIAKKYYKKDWDKVTGKLRDEIYQMAVITVDMQQSESPKNKPFPDRRSVSR